MKCNILALVTSMILSLTLSGQTIQDSIQKIHDNASAFEAIINGPATGDGSTVTLPLGGTQDTLAKAFLQIASSDYLNMSVSQTLTTAQKTQLAANWPEALERLTESELLASGFLKLQNGKIPFSFFPDAFLTPEIMLSDRSDNSYNPITGQSLGEGNGGGAVVTSGSVSPYVLAYGGNPKATTYSSWSPLIENTQSSPAGFGAGETGLAQSGLYLVNYANTKGAAPSNYVSQVTARGSATIEQLQKGSSAGYYETFFLPPLQAVVNTANSNNETIDMPLVYFRQGEQSNAQRVSWRTDFEQLRTDMMDDANAIMSKSRDLKIVSYQTGTAGSQSNAGSILAQWDSFKLNDWHTISSPTYPFYGSLLYNTSDRIHLTSAGYGWLGAYDGRAASYLLYEGEKRCTFPTSAEAAGQIVTVDFSVPSPPLVLDTDNWSVQDFGFKVIDDLGTLTLSNFEAVGTQVTFETDRAISTGGKIRYALDYDFNTPVVANAVSFGVSGNLRDSDSETVDIGGVTRNLHNWCLASDIDVAPDTTAPLATTNVWVTNTDAAQAYTDRKGSTSITEIESTPSFSADGITVAATEALDTNVAANGDSFSAWVVVELNPSFAPASGQSALLLNNKNGTFNEEGFALTMSRQVSGSENLNKFNFATRGDGGGHETTNIFVPDLTGWVLVGFTYDSTTNTRTTFVNSERAWSADSITNSTAWDGNGHTNNMEIGKGSYTHASSGSTTTPKIALVGVAQQSLSTEERDAIIAKAKSRLSPFGVFFDN